MMRDKRKIGVIVLSVFAIIAVISVTYAFISQVLTGTKEVVINAGVLDLVLEEENAITISNALPMHDAVGMIQEDVFVFRLVNKTSNPTNYVLKLTKIEADNELQPSDVKYYLTKEGVGEPKLLSSLPTDGTVDSGTIEGNDTIDYTLRLWIDSDVTSNETIVGKTLSYRIDTEASQEIATLPPFVEQLENIVQVSTNTFPDFAQISSETNGRGIYKYQEDGQDIYYWRGKVDEAEGAANHVIFGGYCWEMVRTTKTGGIKIIYDGEPVEVDGVKTCPNTGEASLLASTSDFNSSNGDNAYVGYMYGLTGVSAELSSPQCIKLNSAGTQAEVGIESTEEVCTQAGGKWATTAYEATHANVVNSTLKTTIDTWFGTSTLNTEENLKKIEDAVYCNDRSIALNAESIAVSMEYTTLGYGTNATAYNAAARVGYKVVNPQPSLECVNEKDRFTVKEENGNGDLTYPVGLLTADELALAGGVFWKSNTDTYLNVGEAYWPLSPYDFDGSNNGLFDMRHIGGLAYSYTNSPIGVRPVISLAPGTVFSEGSGTEGAPYTVE